MACGEVVSCSIQSPHIITILTLCLRVLRTSGCMWLCVFVGGGSCLPSSQIVTKSRALMGISPLGWSGGQCVYLLFVIDPPQMQKEGWLAWLLSASDGECLLLWTGIWTICSTDSAFSSLPGAGVSLNAHQVRGSISGCCLPVLLSTWSLWMRALCQFPSSLPFLPSPLSVT